MISAVVIFGSTSFITDEVTCVFVYLSVSLVFFLVEGGGQLPSLSCSLYPGSSFEAAVK